MPYMALKKCVMIACVTFETVMVVQPAVDYAVNEIHLYHYVREGETTGVYKAFYDEVQMQLKEKLPGIRIVEHAADPVYSFQPMLRGILATVAAAQKDNKDAEILINASSGPSEFTAAAVVASMMVRGAIAFTVGTETYTISNDNVRKLCYDAEGRPVGLSTAVYAPHALPSFEVAMPQENLVRSLRMFAEMRANKRPVTAVSVIAELKKAGLWDYQPNEAEKKTDKKQKEVMYYQRHYIDAWVRNGWVGKPARGAKYDLTDDGKNVTETFYQDH